MQKQIGLIKHFMLTSGLTLPKNIYFIANTLNMKKNYFDIDPFLFLNNIGYDHFSL
jgi:hypothetical protein